MARVLSTIVCGALLVLAACAGPEPRVPDGVVRFDFETGAVGSLPAGFTSALTGGGRPGAWSLQDGGAGRGRVLAQTDADTEEARYPLCLVDGHAAQDVRASVRFATQSGAIDQAAGIVVRCKDASSYWFARANALEGNVRFYRVENGVRKQLASASLEVTAKDWHELVLEARGERFQVEYDGKKLFEHVDPGSQRSGRVGLWTKADSVTWFDDLAIESLDAAR